MWSKKSQKKQLKFDNFQKFELKSALYINQFKRKFWEAGQSVLQCSGSQPFMSQVPVWGIQNFWFLKIWYGELRVLQGIYRLGSKEKVGIGAGGSWGEKGHSSNSGVGPVQVFEFSKFFGPT